MKKEISDKLREVANEAALKTTEMRNIIGGLSQNTAAPVDAAVVRNVAEDWEELRKVAYDDLVESTTAHHEQFDILETLTKGEIVQDIIDLTCDFPGGAPIRGEASRTLSKGAHRLRSITTTIQELAR